MTCNTDSTQFDPAMELLINNGFDGIADTKPRLGRLDGAEGRSIPFIPIRSHSLLKTQS